jgi:regulator of protease activity HflC (stomatin/prohibitin superfamily)
MIMIGILLAIACGMAAIAYTLRLRKGAPPHLVWAAAALAALGLGLGLFHQVFFYAEPGYVYHVRTITGQENVVADVGYNPHLFGRYNAWKRAMTVQAVAETTSTSLNAEHDSRTSSASLPPLNIMFLDQVDADAEATARFLIPTDEASFLEMAHAYRTPENLLRTALIPAFKETLQGTASLMSAETYYSGGRTEFNSEFENQLTHGIYNVRREEVAVKSIRAKATANASLGAEQDQYGDDEKTIWVVRKVLDPNGQPVRKLQKFTDYGIQVIEGRVTDMRPNTKFVERMQLKQKASADRAIAREQKIQEEEQRLLAIAKGEREVAERQASAKVSQIQKTTEAETDKQLAITQAEKLREEAKIMRETAQIKLEKAHFEAETRRTLAEAEAYQKRVILKADNALAQKLDAEIRIHSLWAEAFAQRRVPANVFGAGGGGSVQGAPTGSDSEARTFMQLLTLDAAKRLSYEREIAPSQKTVSR